MTRLRGPTILWSQVQYNYDTRLRQRIDVLIFWTPRRVLQHVAANHRAAGWWRQLVHHQILSKMEQARLSDSVVENIIEHYHNERVLWDVSNTNFIIIRQHTDAWYWYSNSVCLSVHLSVYLYVRNVLVSDENGLTYCHSFFYSAIAQSF